MIRKPTGPDEGEVGFWPAAEAWNGCAAYLAAKAELTTLLAGGVFKASHITYDPQRKGYVLMKQRSFFS
jgi:hypothetical protein